MTFELSWKHLQREKEEENENISQIVTNKEIDLTRIPSNHKFKVGLSFKEGEFSIVVRLPSSYIHYNDIVGKD